MFGEALGLLIFLLAGTFLSGFPSPLFIDCTVNSHIPPPGLFSPRVFLGRPAHILINMAVPTRQSKKGHIIFPNPRFHCKC